MPKVRVLQDDGEIRIAVAGGDPTVYKVSGGTTTVREEDLDLFLGVVDGSEVVEAKKSIEAKPASSSSKGEVDAHIP